MPKLLRKRVAREPHVLVAHHLRLHHGACLRPRTRKCLVVARHAHAKHKAVLRAVSPAGHRALQRLDPLRRRCGVRRVRRGNRRVAAARAEVPRAERDVAVVAQQQRVRAVVVRVREVVPAAHLFRLHVLHGERREVLRRIKIKVLGEHQRVRRRGRHVRSDHRRPRHPEQQRRRLGGRRRRGRGSRGEREHHRHGLVVL
mmetsp:Transcript_9718/g.23956  ORF Transcript_9718/g.23956 Transcript_9718/m.23956 type:complete len:200 (-) Transcript_9718:3584-4183(-)